MYGDFSTTLEAVNTLFDIRMMKLITYENSVYDNLDITLDTIGLKAMCENVSYGDPNLDYAISEAVSDAMSKVKGMIDSIIKTFMQFVNDIKIKILTKITSAETTVAIDKLEKKLKFNPFLQKKKVTIENLNAETKLFKKTRADIQKIVAKVKSGKVPDGSELVSIENDFDSALDGYKTDRKGTTTTVAGAFKLVKEMKGKMAGMIDSCQKETRSALESINDATGSEHANSEQALSKCASLYAKVGREEINSIVRFFKNTLSEVKSAASVTDNQPVDGKKTDDDGDNKNESFTYDELMDDFSSYSTESYNDYDYDIDDYTPESYDCDTDSYNIDDYTPESYDDYNIDDYEPSNNYYEDYSYDSLLSDSGMNNTDGVGLDGYDVTDYLTGDYADVNTDGDYWKNDSVVENASFSDIFADI
jgi:hypothetical protein|nr:MAG TPA: hypothetical protein [Caudoviricetes sp.]